MSDSPRLTVACPECDCRMVVDATTGALVSHQPARRPPAGGRDFDELLGDLDRQRDEAEDVFQQEVAALEHRERLLDEKFSEAMKRAEKLPADEPPPRPFDFD